MKKLIVFPLLVSFIAFFYSTELNAQSCEGPAIFFEEFNQNSVPAGWTVLGLDTNTLFHSEVDKGFTGEWQSYYHYGAQCMANSAKFADVTASPDDYIITPLIHLGSAPVCLSWKSARALDLPSGNIANEEYDVMISTSGANLSGLQSNPHLAVISDTSSLWKSYSVDLSTYAGQDVNIGFWHHTPGYGYALYLDDIRIGQPVNLDLRISGVRLHDVVSPATVVTIEGTLNNAGLTTVSSASINWNVNNGAVNAYSLTGISLAPYQSVDFLLPATWTAPAAGTYVLKVWSADPNGVADQYNLNDTLIRYIFVSTNSRKVLQEEFTQASCPPCAISNPAYDILLDANRLAGKVSVIKYHVGWPGFDPMYNLNTQDALDRVRYKGIYAVPTGLQDGRLIDDCPLGYFGAISCLDQWQIDSASAIPSPFHINITTAENGSDYQVNYEVEALSDFPLTSFRVYAAVTEEYIQYPTPPGTNGEYEFPFVMRKMLPDAGGVAMPPLIAGQKFIQTFTTPILPDYTNTMLRVVVFIEDNSNQHIYQSEMTDEEIETGIADITAAEVIRVFPIPAKDRITISFNKAESNSIFTISNLLGEEVLQLRNVIVNGNSNAQLDIGNLNSGIYLLNVVNSNGSFTQKIIKE
jgi:hypothetical protein